MVRYNEYLLSLYTNNFPLSVTTHQTLIDKIASSTLSGEGIYVVPGGRPTLDFKVEDAAARIHNMRVELTSAIEWRIYGDIESLNTPSGVLLETIDFKELQFWVRGMINRGLGLIDFLYISFTMKAAAQNKFLSFQKAV